MAEVITCTISIPAVPSLLVKVTRTAKLTGHSLPGVVGLSRLAHTSKDPTFSVTKKAPKSKRTLTADGKNDAKAISHMCRV